MELQEYLEGVCDQRSFLAFVKALIADRKEEIAKDLANPSSPYGPGTIGWENGSIEAFLIQQPVGLKIVSSVGCKGFPIRIRRFSSPYFCVAARSTNSQHRVVEGHRFYSKGKQATVLLPGQPSLGNSQAFMIGKEILERAR